jgi:hypothetical protein
MPLSYQREISDDDIKAMEHYVLDAKEWIDDAITQKIKSCKKRLVQRMVDDAISTDSPLPANVSGSLAEFFGKPEYKNRKEREKEELAPPQETIEKEGHGQPPPTPL